MQVVIVGAGLSGLYLAKLLQDHPIEVQLFEARDRIGGRVYSVDGCDLGPTWYWPNENPLIQGLVREFKLEVFEQWAEGFSLYQVGKDAAPQLFQAPNGYSGALRISGGMSALVAELHRSIPKVALQLNHRLVKLALKNEGIELEFWDSATNAAKLTVADKVIICAPPRVVAKNISFVPALDPQFVDILTRTPTWMAGHAKAVLFYRNAFWREQGLSGSAYTNFNDAFIGEGYDAFDPISNRAALASFIGLPPEARQLPQHQLEQKAIVHFCQLFGAEAEHATSVVIKDWCTDPYTSTHDDWQLLRSHPQYGHKWFQLDHWQDRLFFCGSETSRAAGGYMEGALQSAARTAINLF